MAGMFAEDSGGIVNRDDAEAGAAAAGLRRGAPAGMVDAVMQVTAARLRGDDIGHLVVLGDSEVKFSEE
jgi:hypothetical protein